jgi:hypothetical protein
MVTKAKNHSSFIMFLFKPLIIRMGRGTMKRSTFYHGKWFEWSSKTCGVDLRMMRVFCHYHIYKVSLGPHLLTERKHLCICYVFFNKLF